MASVNPQKHEEEVFNKLTQELTGEFRTHARKYGWKPDLVNQISVVWDENGFGFDYPSSIEAEVDDAEHGEVGGSPARAMLTFKNEVMPRIVEGVASAYVDTILDSDAFE